MPNTTIPAPAQGFSLDHQVAPYLQYALTTSYQYDPGTLDMPVAYQTGTSLGKSVEVVQVSQPRGRKVVQFSIRRLGAEPVAPDPLALSPGLTLLGSVLTPVAPNLAPDGTTYVYGLDGHYIYALAQPVTGQQGLALPRTPVDGGNQQTLPPGQFVGGLV